jgi:hypothetical protein
MKKLRAIVVALSLVLGTVGVGNVQAVQYPEYWEIGTYIASAVSVGALALMMNAGRRGKKFANFVVAEISLGVGACGRFYSRQAAAAYDYCTETETLTRADGSEKVEYKHGVIMTFISGIIVGITACAAIALGVNVVGLIQRGRNVAAAVAAVGGAGAVAAGAVGGAAAFRPRPRY